MAATDPSSVEQTVLLYALREPGGWTAARIVDDLDGLEIDEVRRALRTLRAEGLPHGNSIGGRIWPTRAGKVLIREAV